MAANHTQRAALRQTPARRRRAAPGNTGRRARRWARRHRGSRAASTSRIQSGGCIALADAHQAAHDVADHVMQEGIGLELEAPVAASPSPWRVISMRRRSLTGERAWQAEARNELKSCSPTSSAAAARIASPSSGCIDQPTRPASRLGPHRRLRAARRRSAAPRALARQWNCVGHRLRPLHRDVGAAGSGWCRAPRRTARARAAVSKCTTCIRPCTPASVRPAQSVEMGCAANLRERGFELVLHRAARELALPAFVGLSVVADAERQPHGRAQRGRRADRLSASSAEQLLGAAALRSPELRQRLLRPASARLRRRRCALNSSRQRQLGGERARRRLSSRPSRRPRSVSAARRRQAGQRAHVEFDEAGVAGQAGAQVAGCVRSLRRCSDGDVRAGSRAPGARVEVVFEVELGAASPTGCGRHRTRSDREALSTQSRMAGGARGSAAAGGWRRLGRCGWCWRIGRRARSRGRGRGGGAAMRRWRGRAAVRRHGAGRCRASVAAAEGCVLPAWRGRGWPPGWYSGLPGSRSWPSSQMRFPLGAVAAGEVVGVGGDRFEGLTSRRLAWISSSLRWMATRAGLVRRLP